MRKHTEVIPPLDLQKKGKQQQAKKGLVAGGECKGGKKSSNQTVVLAACEPSGLTASHFKNNPV